jgi:hypothetical protein
MSRTRNLLLGSALALPATVVVLAGCGGDNGSKVSASPPSTSSTTTTPSGGGQRLSLSANPSGKLEFSKMQLAAKQGKVTLVMKNPPLPVFSTASPSRAMASTRTARS